MNKKLQFITDKVREVCGDSFYHISQPITIAEILRTIDGQEQDFGAPIHAISEGGILLEIYLEDGDWEFARNDNDENIEFDLSHDLNWHAIHKPETVDKIAEILGYENTNSV